VGAAGRKSPNINPAREGVVKVVSEAGVDRGAGTGSADARLRRVVSGPLNPRGAG
jgi:hypothetical protein